MIIWSGFLDLFFGGAGIWCLVKTFSSGLLGIKSKSWPTVEGNITTSETEKMEGEDTEGIRLVAYKPNIRYSYTVSGVQYTSSRISFEGIKTSGKIAAKEMLARYPIGKQITVYYNPRNPQQSTLQTNYPQKDLIAGLCIGLFFISMAIVLFFLITVPELSK